MILAPTRPRIWMPADGPAPPLRPWWLDLFNCGGQRKSTNGGGRRDATRGCVRRSGTTNPLKFCCGCALCTDHPVVKVAVTIFDCVACTCGQSASTGSAKLLSGTPNGSIELALVASSSTSCTWRSVIPSSASPAVVGYYAANACAGSPAITSVTGVVQVSLTSAGVLGGSYYAGDAGGNPIGPVFLADNVTGYAGACGTGVTLTQSEPCTTASFGDAVVTRDGSMIIDWSQ